MDRFDRRSAVGYNHERLVQREPNPGPANHEIQPGIVAVSGRRMRREGDPIAVSAAVFNT